MPLLSERKRVRKGGSPTLFPFGIGRKEKRDRR